MECLLLKAITPIYLGAEKSRAAPGGRSPFSAAQAGRRDVWLWIPEGQGAWALVNPAPCTSMASFPIGSNIPRAGAEFGTSGPSVTSDSIYICYLLWKTTEGDNEALSGETGMKNVIFAVGFIPHFWVLLFSCRLKASPNPVILKSSGKGRKKPFISTLIIAAAWVLEINTELGWKMETANATSYLISSIIMSIHLSVGHCLPLMQPIIAAMLTVRADLPLSKSRSVQGSSSPGNDPLQGDEATQHLMTENFTLSFLVSSIT